MTMDSAYIGDILAQIGREEWKINNMVGMVQSNWMGASMKQTIKKMKKCTYELVFWQHTSLPLVYVAWSDNEIVNTLSNHHNPLLLEVDSGLMRKKKGDDAYREKSQKPVQFPCKLRSNVKHFILLIREI
jgi:hypothetical protein